MSGNFKYLQIVNELSQFENLCKTTRDNLRAATIARDKEVLKQQQLIEIKSKFTANNVSLKQKAKTKKKTIIILKHIFRRLYFYIVVLFTFIILISPY